MAGRREHQADDDQGVAVDAALESELGSVEASIAAYLANPSADRRRDLLVTLERLDRRIDDSDAYEGSVVGSGAFGYADKGAVIGETSIASTAEEVPGSVLRAQVLLIRAAKREVTAPTADTFAELRDASVAVAAARGTEPPPK